MVEHWEGVAGWSTAKRGGEGRGCHWVGRVWERGEKNRRVAQLGEGSGWESGLGFLLGIYTPSQKLGSYGPDQ